MESLAEALISRYLSIWVTGMPLDIYISEHYRDLPKATSSCESLVRAEMSRKEFATEQRGRVFLLRDIRRV